MDFALSEFQQLLKEQAERFIERDYGFEQRRAIIAAEPGFSAAHWRTFAELGWLGLPFDEADGGFGGTPADLAILFEAFGRGLVVEPYLATVLGGLAVERGGNPAQKAAILPGLIAGTHRLALASTETGGRPGALHVATKARKVTGGWQLSGHKAVVLHGASADTLVVVARSHGAHDAPGGIGLFLVPARAYGLSRRGYATVDGLRAAEITLDRVELGEDALLGDAAGGYGLLDGLLDVAAIAGCAEALGCMGALIDRTAEYLRTREQFGRRIGEFQVLQHALVDMYMAAEQARSITLAAALKAGAPRVETGVDAGERQRLVAAARQFCTDAGRLVGQTAVQLHGGIGVTDELDVAHYFKRLTMLPVWFADNGQPLDRFQAAAA
jgi:alkylation response protein AidB-like acyl-CoA dehydrogenase